MAADKRGGNFGRTIECAQTGRCVRLLVRMMLLGLLSACAHVPAPPPAAADPLAHAEQSLTSAADDGPSLLGSLPNDERLQPLARQLTARCQAESAGCTAHLESVLASMNLPERPLLARLIPTQGRFDQTARQAVRQASREWFRQGFLHQALSPALDKAGHTRFVVLVGQRRELSFDAPPPAALMPGAPLALTGSIRDDTGLLWLVWRAPHGATFEEAWPVFAGRFDIRVSLLREGRYSLEIERAESSGQRRSMARLEFLVSSEGKTPAATALPPLTPVSVSDFADRLRQSLDEARRGLGLERTQSLQLAEGELTSALESEAAWPAAAALVDRPFALKAYPYLDCRLYSSYTENASAFLAERLDRPVFRARTLDPSMTGYRVRAMTNGVGWRVAELACRFWTPPQSPLIEWSMPEARHEWFARQEQRLTFTFGMTHTESPALMRARVSWLAALQLLVVLEDRRADLPELIRTHVHPLGDDVGGLTDEAFVTLYEARELYRRQWPSGDPRVGSMSRYLCMALLMQGRADACQTEMMRLASLHDDARLVAARQNEIQAALAAQRNETEMALSSLLASMHAYDTLSQPQALERLALEAAKLFPAPGSEPPAVARRPLVPTPSPFDDSAP